MAQQSPHQLFLLADHLKLSLLERQRAKALNLQDPAKQDSHISRSLDQLQDGLEALRTSQGNSDPDTLRLQQQYDSLYAQFHGVEPTTRDQGADLTRPNDESLRRDFDAARRRPPSSPATGTGTAGVTGKERNVRFRDDPDAARDGYRDDPEQEANRAALFQDASRYRDEPAAPDRSALSNQQVHAYHKQVLRDQDQQLDTLGQSIGRQRVLGVEMGRELDEQVEMLDDVEAGVDRHQSTLDRARRRLGNVARKSKDNWNWVTIGILIVILVLLIIVLD